MKIIVGVKRVIDYRVRVKLKADNSDVDLTNTKMAINPFCEIAIEEALRMREAGHAEEVIAVSVGDSASNEQLRAALALGADRGIRVDADAGCGPLNVAKILHALVEREQAKLVLLGKQAIDSDNNQVGQMLAALWGCAQATNAYQITMAENSLDVGCEVDGGLKTYGLDLPAVVTVDLRLNQPRFAKLPAIMQARRKPLEEIAPTDLGVSLKAHSRLHAAAAPPTRNQGRMVDNVDALLAALCDEQKILEKV